MEAFAVIMAGGHGERFWPYSRNDRPKQFLNILGPGPLLERTFKRLEKRFDAAHILVAGSREHRAAIRHMLPQLSPDNLICEPCGRNTAPCVAVVSGLIKKRCSDALLLFIPADQWIGDDGSFALSVDSAIREAEHSSSIVVIGIHPDHPSPEYGYIEAIPSGKPPFQVRRFIEKPSVAEAEKLLESGDYYWNCGMFIMPIRTLEKELEQHSPELASLMAAAARCRRPTPALWRRFAAAPKISFDYAVLEHSRCIRLLPAAFQWDDLGNWQCLHRHRTADHAGNVVCGEAELLDCRDCTVFTDDGADFLVAAIGLEDFVVAKSRNAILIAPRSRIGRLKNLLGEFEDGHQKFL